VPDEREQAAATSQRQLTPRHVAGGPPRRPAGSTLRQPAPWEAQAVQASGTSGMAIAAFVLGLVGVPILGMVLGIVALRRIRRTLQQGSGLAIAGIVLSCVWLVFTALVIVIGLRSDPGSAPSAAASGGASNSRTVDPFSLATGDCFENPTPTAGQQQTFATVVQTPCTQPHNAQIFATFNVSGSLLSYPGDAAMHSLASSGCTARVRATLDGAKLTDSMSIRFLYPLQASWLGGHRTISCIVFNPTPTLTSSLLKS